MLDFGVVFPRQRKDLLQFNPPQEEDIRFLLITCVAVGVGSRLGPQLRSQTPLKSVAHTIRLADGLMKGATTIQKLRSPTPANLASFALEAAKALAKGGSKGLIVKDKSACFKKIFKGIKASEGALNLVRYCNILNYGAADPLDSVIKGYKLTNSAFNVLDGVNGVRSAAAAGYVGIKEGMEGVGVVVKAMVLYKQTHGFFIQGFRVSRELWDVLRKYNKNEEERIKEILQKGCGRQRVVCEFHCWNPYELKLFHESGLEVFVR